MERLSLEQHKEIMLSILKEFHTYCVKHNIKYSLSGGSLIGAVREGGIIPWDDDIDVILMPEEYEKFEKALKNDKLKFEYIGYNNMDGYYNPGFKIVDNKTKIIEKGKKQNYGVFIDVFRYNYIPDNPIIRKFYTIKYKYMLSIIHGFSPFSKNTNNLLKKMRNRYSERLNIRDYLNKFYAFLDKYNKKKTAYIAPNSIMYSFKKETQESKYMKEYKTVKFDNIEAMISTDYDALLTKMFGDYMTPPPEEERFCKHTIEVFKK